MDYQQAQEIIDKTRESYNKIARHFFETRSKVWPDFNDKFSKYFKDGQKVLDLGCGSGRFWQAFRGFSNIKYLGVDFSEKLIEIAKEQNKDERAEFVVGDILNARSAQGAFTLGVKAQPDKKFDVILCIAVLHHIPSQELRLKFLGQVKNMLAEDGVLIVTAWDLWNESSGRKSVLKQTLSKIAGKNKMDFGDVLIPWKNQQGEVLAQRYYHAFTKKSLVDLVKRAGLKAVESGVLRGHSKGHRNFYVVASRESTH